MVAETSASPDLAAARERIRRDHSGTVAAVLRAADAVAAGFESPPTDGTDVAESLERELRARSALAPLLTLLSDAVEASGRAFPATPVPAPPYLAVTSRGPVLRATVDDGRIVVRVVAFAVERAPTRYVRAGTDPASAVDVSFVPADATGGDDA